MRFVCALVVGAEVDVAEEGAPWYIGFTTCEDEEAADPLLAAAAAPAEVESTLAVVEPAIDADIAATIAGP